MENIVIPLIQCTAELQSVQSANKNNMCQLTK